MDERLATRRRVLVLTYQRYLAVDRAWSEARNEARRWCPGLLSDRVLAIGAPRSRMRRLAEERDRALMQLEAARVKFFSARQELQSSARHNRKRIPA